jgi:hypothetical protein
VDLRCAEDGRADEVAGEVEAEPLLLRQRHLRTPGDADRALGGRRRTDVVGCLASVVPSSRRSDPRTDAGARGGAFTPLTHLGPPSSIT